MSVRRYFCLSSVFPILIPLLLYLIEIIFNNEKSYKNSYLFDIIILSGAVGFIPYVTIFFVFLFLINPVSAVHFAWLNAASLIVFPMFLYYMARSEPSTGIVFAAFGLAFSILYSLIIWSIYLLLDSLSYIKH